MAKHGIGDMNRSGGASKGANISRMNPATGGSTGHGQHKMMPATGQTTTIGQFHAGVAKAERLPKSQHRGTKPKSSHMEGQPATGTSGGGLGGQTVGKIG